MIAILRHLRELRSAIGRLLLRLGAKLAPHQFDEMLRATALNMATEMATGLVRSTFTKAGYAICAHPMCMERFGLRKAGGRMFCPKHAQVTRVA